MQWTVAQYAKKNKMTRQNVYRMIRMKLLAAPLKAKVFLTRIYITDED